MGGWVSERAVVPFLIYNPEIFRYGRIAVGVLWLFIPHALRHLNASCQRSVPIESDAPF
uniref:Uncharacterized protein n=1 Tax=Utricularia reniformis TaxID=192314 RepID=A0A1Y0AYN1_9LAMI|nr:hypothetical protein AEK19_MT0189 [Utricularia reniformis]ART30262.1 hypothetical protein AEK19_MT0189 [Utricularia reniformis]